MSLINQMLQDLDARGTHASAAGVMQGQIRVVPERSGMRIAAVLGIVLLVLAALIGGFWWWQAKTPAPQAAAVPTPGPNPTVNPLPATPPVAPGTEVRLADFSLKMASELSQVPLPEVKDLPPTPAVVASASIAAGVTAPASVEAVKAPSRDMPVPARNPVAPVREARERMMEPAVPVVLDKQVKELTPQQNAENAYRNGATLIQQGRAQEAIVALEQALQFDPGHAAARQTLVAVLLENKRKDDALRRLREGLQLDPGQTGLAMILARLQVDRGETTQAIETLQKSLPYAGERADYPAFLAALLQREARHREAIEQYNAALRRSPQNGVWWMGLGISLQAEHRLPEAGEAFNRAKSAGTLSPELRAFVDEKLANLQR